MKIFVEIEQIDDGFIVSLFDADGKEEYDKKIHIDNLDAVLKTVDEWVGDIIEREANGEDEEEEAMA